MRAAPIPRADVEEHLRADRVGLRLRAGLIGEILRAYVRVRWLLARHDDVEAVLVRLRAGMRDDWSDDDARRLGQRLARPVLRTLAPLPLDTRCLVRSLVLVRMLSRRNVACDLVIGVVPGEAFAAHAWVERAGRALLPTEGFAPLAVL